MLLKFAETFGICENQSRNWKFKEIEDFQFYKPSVFYAFKSKCLTYYYLHVSNTKVCLPQPKIQEKFVDRNGKKNPPNGKKDLIAQNNRM